MDIAIIYSTQMGSTEMLVDVVRRELEGDHEVVVESALEAGIDTVRHADLVVFAIPTYDDGQIESSAQPFFEMLEQEVDIKTKYAMIAPGDSAYPEFCKAYDRIKEMVGAVGMVEVQEPLKIDQYFNNIETHNERIKEWVGSLIEVES